MSIDDRLRDGLHANTAGLGIGLEHEFDLVLRRGQRRRRVRAGSVVVAMVVVVVCAALAWLPGSVSSLREPNVPGHDTIDTSPAPPTPLTDRAVDEALAAGRYSAEFGASAVPSQVPRVVVEVPAGFKSGDRYEVYSEAGGFRHLSMWTASKVVEDPCGGPRYVDPGPSVQDLADALVALPVWRTSTPRPVTVDGHHGLVMDFDVPDPIPAGCGAMYHWVDSEQGTQAVDAGKRQRLWILDVDGQRVVVMAGYFPQGTSSTAAGVTPAQARELLHMVETLTFTSAGG